MSNLAMICIQKSGMILVARQPVLHNRKKPLANDEVWAAGKLEL